MTSSRPYLLDVTRLLATGWARRKPTGLDRVCSAYLRHYGARALAVVQHRGVFRVLTARHSDALFGLLAEPRRNFRLRLTQMAPSILVNGAAPDHYRGKIYINVGHTDFDLPSHWQWIEAAGLQSFYMLHDLIPIKHPDFTYPHAVRRHLARVVQAISNADGVIANSQSTVEDLRSFAQSHGLRMPPVVPAHLGVDHVIRKLPPAQDCKKHFVCLSTIEPRKNHHLLLRVWRKLIANSQGEPPNLVLIGQWGRNHESVRTLLRNDPQLAAHVTVLDDCGDAEMLQWIRSAAAVLLPSMAEGYGLPLAEAMAAGTPVIASDLPCFREIGDAIPLLVPATEEAAWESAITGFLHDRREADRQRALLSSHRARRWADHFQLVDDWMSGLRHANVTKFTANPRPSITSAATAAVAIHRSLFESAP